MIKKSSTEYAKRPFYKMGVQFVLEIGDVLNSP